MSEAPSAPDPGRRVDHAAAGARVARLYEAHARAVLGISRMLLRDAHEAEDAAQASFLAAYAALLRGAVPRDDAAWLFAIARNECRSRIRARMAAPLTGGEDALGSIAARDGDPAERGVDPSVRRALAALPARQREAVVLHDVLGLRAREVARLLGVTLPAVEALLFRARRRLRVRLRPLAGALTLPVGLRDALVQAIPGFADGSGGAGAAATGAAGLGMLAKLASGPAVAKVTAATVAVTAAGTVAVAHRERPPDAPAATRSHAVMPRMAASAAQSRDPRQRETTAAVTPVETRAGDGHEDAGARSHRSDGAEPDDVGAGVDDSESAGRGTRNDPDKAVVARHGGSSEHSASSGRGADDGHEPEASEAHSQPERADASDEPALEALTDGGDGSGPVGVGEREHHDGEISSVPGAASAGAEPDDVSSGDGGPGSDGGHDGSGGGSHDD